MTLLKKDRYYTPTTVLKGILYYLPAGFYFDKTELRRVLYQNHTKSELLADWRFKTSPSLWSETLEQALSNLWGLGYLERKTGPQQLSKLKTRKDIKKADRRLKETFSEEQITELKRIASELVKEVGLPKRIETLQDLVNAAELRRSVLFKPWKKPLPAAAILNMQGKSIHKLIQMGLTLYERKQK